MRHIQIQLEPFCPSKTLAALAGCIAESQAALLANRLPEFERGIARQTLLCDELRHQKTASVHKHDISKSDITRVRAQSRLLAAVLRRMRQNLSALQNALQGCALTYPPTTCAMHRRN
jgi:hypothetical protein